MSAEPKTERVELTISVAESVLDISMTGVQIECAAEIVGAAVTSLMTVTQRDRRDAERERVHRNGEEPTIAADLAPTVH